MLLAGEREELPEAILEGEVENLRGEVVDDVVEAPTPEAAHALGVYSARKCVGEPVVGLREAAQPHQFARQLL